MIFKEYNVSIGGLQRRLGLLGENHIYTPEERDSFREIVSNYDYVAFESNGKCKSKGLLFASLLLTPAMIAYTLGNKAHENRDDSIENSMEIAKEQHKCIVYLEDNEKESYPLSTVLSLATMGALLIPFTPLIYLHARFSKSSALEQLKKSKVQEKFYDKMFNQTNRDEIMTREICFFVASGVEKLLAVFGESHFKGVKKNLEDRLDLTEVAG